MPPEYGMRAGRLPMLGRHGYSGVCVAVRAGLDQSLEDSLGSPSPANVSRQVALEDLAARVLRQRIDELDVLRALVPGQAIRAWARSSSRVDRRTRLARRRPP